MKSKAKRLFCLIIMAALLAVLVPVQVLAQSRGESSNPKKVVMVILNRVSYPELSRWKPPNLAKLAGQGGSGFLTLSLGSDLSDANGYASIGAGSKIAVSGDATASYQGNEEIMGSKAIDIYKRHSGLGVNSGSVIQVSLAAWLENTKRLNQPISQGALGEALHQSDKKTAVIGNSDLSLDQEKYAVNRLAPLMAMDSKGIVDYGQVSTDLLVKDDGYPMGLRTNYHRLWQAFNEAYEESDFLVIETGDTVRLETEAISMTPEMEEGHRQAVVLAADQFIGKLLSIIDKDTILMVVDPLPPTSYLDKGEKLTPLYIAGGGIPPNSILGTPSTRHPGIITYYDLSATVLSHLGANKLPLMLGIPVYGEKVQDRGTMLNALYTKAVYTYNLRGPMLIAFISYQIGVLVILLLTLIFKVKSYPRLLEWATLSLATSSLSILLLPMVGNLPLWGLIAAWLAISLVLIRIITIFKGALNRIIILGAITSIVILLDVVLGTPLMRWSFLGYDLIVGGRFYGIGNEYMGVLIGASIISLTASMDKFKSMRKWLLLLTIACFAVITFFFASPALGTNAGGALAALVGYTVTLYRLKGWQFNWRTLAIVFVVAVSIGVLGLIGVNKLVVTGQESHIGRASSDLLKGNFSVIYQIVLRKIMANWYLIMNSAWNKLVLAALLTVGWIYYRYRSDLVAALKDYPALGHGLAGIAAGAIAALLFNDSGVVALATMSVFLIIPLYYIVQVPIKQPTLRR